MSKSPNKHNRITAKAVPMDEKLSEDIDKGKFNTKDEPKVRAKVLADEYGWDKTEAGTKLWCFGPENCGPNILVDGTKGI